MATCNVAFVGTAARPLEVRIVREGKAKAGDSYPGGFPFLHVCTTEFSFWTSLPATSWYLYVRVCVCVCVHLIIRLSVRPL